MKEAFTADLHLSKPNVQRLQTVNGIISEYAKQGYTLTLRQLYYQLVSRDIIANKLAEYSKLSGLLVKGRMAGVVDWDAIEDRIRVPYLPYSADDIANALGDLSAQYRLNRQEGQENYIELWVEKDALSGVLRPLSQEYHISLMVNRGYSSCTAMHDAYKRLNRAINDGKTAYILYLGDHDPSGLDMIRDITNRLQEFGLESFDFDTGQHGEEFTVKHIALTTEQVEKYQPPPNPAKFTDPRAGAYMAEHGQTSWEVDALNPATLHELIREVLDELVDKDKFDAQIEQEEKDKKKLQAIRKQLQEE